MAKPFSEKFYKTSVWRDCRNGYAAYRGHLCEGCLRRGILSHGEIVHHKIHLTPQNINDLDIALGEDNLETLCRECHAIEHQGESPTADGLMFDEAGNLVERKPYGGI